MYCLNMVTKYMLARDSIRVHKWKIIRDRGRRLEDIWVSVKKERNTRLDTVRILKKLPD